jgi:hypothetical protein
MRLSLLGVAAALAVALVGCASPVAVVTPDPESQAEVDWDARFAEFVTEHGERPEPTPYVDAQVESARLAEATERAWEGVVASYPTAERPEAPFVHWATDADHLDLESDVNRCLTAAGAKLSTGTDADGEPVAVEYSAAPDATTATALFACQFLAYPLRPLDGSAGAGWLWDFADAFLVPCLEAHGATQDPLPTRDEQIAAVFSQGYGWIPHFPESSADVGPDADVYAACHGDEL